VTRPSRRPGRLDVIARGLLVLVCSLVAATPAAAKILKTRVQRPSGHRLPLNVGSGFEYETDTEESEYGFPFLAEYGFTKQLKLSLEPSYVLIRKKAGASVSGMGDFETTLACEFPTERRYRPGVALEGVIKWPAARRGDLGTGETDYSIGAVVSKEFVPFDLDLSGVYTFIGSPPGVHLKDTFEGSLAVEWHLGESMDLEGEFVTSLGAGGHFRGSPGSLGGFANIGGPEQGQTESEGTLGLAEKLNDFLKLEQGVVLKSGGSFQFVFAWEWDFSGGQ
jgi:hypothetical protein